MIDSPSDSPYDILCGDTSKTEDKKDNEGEIKYERPDIPIELVSDEEMATIEAVLATATRSSIYSLPATSSSLPLISCQLRQLRQNVGSASTVNLVAKRGVSSLSGSDPIPDIEDSGGSRLRSPLKKKSKADDSLLSRFRGRRGLSVTDITSTEWCEKQMEFSLRLGKRERTNAMRLGSMRHAELEEEVLKRVEVSVKTSEDVWALKLINFIIGANQLLFEGLTRELPVIGLVQGVWMVGVIDELRMPVTGTARNPMLVDTKTRGRANLPTEPQQRNGRLQLMCYKYLWDNLTADNFSSLRFFDFFSLNPHYNLSDDIKECAANSGFPVETLDELVMYFRNSCSTMPRADERLLLRYELQDDNSLIGEDQFQYEKNWLEGQIQRCFELWQGEREPSYVTDGERWKCKFCQYAHVCPAQGAVSSPSSSQN